MLSAKWKGKLKEKLILGEWKQALTIEKRA